MTGTKLREILVEDWRNEGSHGPTPVIMDSRAFEVVGRFDTEGIGRLNEVRASVAVLGKRALALMIMWEEGAPPCSKESGCGVHKHGPGCEWGRIIEESRKIG